MASTLKSKPVGDFTITEMYIQQRDSSGNPIGEKLYLIKASTKEVGENVQDTLLPTVYSVNINQSMISTSIRGNVVFIDRNRALENIKLSPLDLLFFKIVEKTEGTVINKEITVSIISVSQLSNDATAAKMGTINQPRTIQIDFAANEHYLLNYSYFDFMDNDFIGPISGEKGIIQYISDKVFKHDSTPFSTSKKGIQADPTGNYVWLKKYHNMYPWGKPVFPPLLSSFIQMLTENAVDEKNPNAANFMFWQDLDGWNFKSVESIIKNSKEYPVYFFSDIHADARGIYRIDLNVDGSPETDFMNMLKNGSFGSNYLFVEPKYQQDPYARYLDVSGAHEIKEIDYVYTRDYEKWESIEEMPVLSDKEYIKKWSHNRMYDDFYGYFEPNVFNRKKSVSWEYYGYTYSNRQEESLWQTVFDITDMDGKILRKIQKEIKEPLAKKRYEYARKMNLKEKWKVYRCSICCAGIELNDELGYTLTNALSTYEIVSAGSFTDVFNYLPTKQSGPVSNSYLLSGLTLSYDLKESPYNLTIGEFLNLEESPDNFIKYRFDLEIIRHQKMLEMIDRNTLARENRVQSINDAYDFYRGKYLAKTIDCGDSDCRSDNCPCHTAQTVHGDGVDGPEPGAGTYEAFNNNTKNWHNHFVTHPSSVSDTPRFKESIQKTIQKLQELKEEFISLYQAYWSRKAFFFSKEIDYSFMKSGNNLLNVKSIKRIPIKGSKYEPFATRKALSGFTFKDGSTAFYPYSISKNICNDQLSDSLGSTANPYFDRKYSEDPKADFWISFKNPYSKFSYSDREFSDVPKGPIWYRNYKVSYKLGRRTRFCPSNAATYSGPRVCVKGCQGPITQRCSSSVTPYDQEEQDSICSSDFGIQGEDWVYGKCDEFENRQFVNGILSDLIFCATDPFFAECPAGIGYMTPECCSGFLTEWDNNQEYCNHLQSIGCQDSPVYRTSCINPLPPPTYVDLDISYQGTCDYDGFNTDISTDTGVLIEIFSNDKNLLLNHSVLNEAIRRKLSSNIEKNIENNLSVSALLYTRSPWENYQIGVEPISDVKLLHPWGADELGENGDFTVNDYNNYKKAASLFEDDLTEKIPPSLHLEGLESYVRIEFKSPIGLETLKDFPDGFVNTPGSEYFLPYIVLLTAGPFGAESARTNVSVIGQDPFGFDVAVKKIKNKDDFAKMNLHDYGSGISLGSLSCSPYSTSSSWLRRSQDAMFYRPNSTGSELYTPSGIQDIFCASSLQRSAPVKSWWDLWVSLPPVAIALYHNRLDVPDNILGRYAFADVESFRNTDYAGVIGKDTVVFSDGSVFSANDWPIYVKADTENIVAGLYPATIIINKTRRNELEKSKNKLGKYPEILDGIIPTGNVNNLNSTEITQDVYSEDNTVKKIIGYSDPYQVANSDPEAFVFYEVDYPHINEVDPNKNYPLMSYPVGTVVYGGPGFTAGQVWKFDISRKTEYGIVQLSSDSMPSILSLIGGIGGNIESIQKYYEWWNNKLFDWYQNTVFDNNFSAQFVVFSKQKVNSCKDYPCANSSPYIGENNCPPNDPLCKCPCQELRPDKITKVKDRFTGAMIPALTGDFGPEPSSLELKKLKDETNECALIKQVLGEEWLGCVWDDPTSPYNCKCPCVGSKFYDYMKYNRTQSTFWNTPLHTPLFRNAQMNLLMSNKIKIHVAGDLAIKTGMIIKIDSSSNLIENKKKRYDGKWLVLEIDHIMQTGNHVMILTLVRDSNPKIIVENNQ